MLIIKFILISDCIFSIHAGTSTSSVIILTLIGLSILAATAAAAIVTVVVVVFCKKNGRGVEPATST